jgi:membrane-bound lytic murein transglycosylase B
VLILLVGALLVAQAQVFAQSRSFGRSSEDRRMLETVARMYGFDPDLLRAIAHVESHENPAAVSPKGAQGLMQLMPATAAQYGVSDPFDPIENMLGAARFLNHLRSWQLEHPQMRLPEMLAAYNAGENAVVRYGGVPPYAETQEYVRRVLLVYLLGDQAVTARPAQRLARTAGTSHKIIANSTPIQKDRRSFDTRTLDQLQDIKRRRELATVELH